MLVVRQAQIDALARAMRAAFERQMAQSLGDALVARHGAHHGASGLDLVRRGVERAARYGITDAAHVAVFLEFMVAAGVDFDEKRWARRVLLDTVASVPLRLDALRERIAKRAPR